MPRGSKENKTGRGWRGQGVFELRGRSRDRHGRSIVSSGRPHSGEDLICCATGMSSLRETMMLSEEIEEIKEVIRRDGYISISY